MHNKQDNQIITLKMFGTGQITLPKFWRQQFDTKNFTGEVREDGILIKPLQKSVYYEKTDGSFGVHFPKGVDPSELLTAIEKLDGKPSQISAQTKQKKT